MTLTPSTIRVDLKCGRGAISQGEKCHKGPATKRKQEPLLTAGNIAKFATAVLAPVALERALKSQKGRRLGKIARTMGASIGKKPFPKGKTKAEWFELQNSPGIREGNRLRRYEANARMRSISHEEFADRLRDVAGSSREANNVAELIRKHKIQIDSGLLDDVIDGVQGRTSLDPDLRRQIAAFRKQQQINPRVEGFFLDTNILPNAPNNKVYINYRRSSNSEWKPSKEGISKAMSTYRSARENSVKTAADIAKDPSPETIETYQQAFATYQNADGDDRDLLLGLHEIGHALDIGIGKRQRPLTVRDPRTKQLWITRDPEFDRQARKITSHYGQSDLNMARDEFFAESFVLYTLYPTYMRDNAPLVYHWMDDYIAQLRQA